MSKEILKNKNHTSHFAPHTSNRGITLLSLILTVIIMLILTGVALSIALGENGIVEKAKEATTQTQVAMDRELLLSAAIGAMGNDGKINLSAMVLPEGFTGSNGTYTSKNGNTFTVSENGTVVYTGGSDSNEGEVALDLNGKYYYDLMENDYDFYYEIRNNNTLVVVEEGMELNSLPIVIDEENQTITGTYEYEESDFDGGVAIETIVYNYEVIKENGKVVNIIFRSEDGYETWFQNTNGFEYDLNGTYLSSDGNYRISFNNEGKQEQQRKDSYTGDWIWESGEISEVSFYFAINGRYHSTYCGAFEVSGDKSTINMEGRTYTKQNN